MLKFAIYGLPSNSKGVSLFNENFKLINTLDSENWQDQNSEGNKTVTTEVSEDSVATHSEIHGFSNVGLLCNKHIKNLLFLISGAKLDFIFPRPEFTIPGHMLFRKDGNQHGGDLIFYMSQVTPCKTIDTVIFPNSPEVLNLEINLRNEKILVIGCYKPSSLNDEYFGDQLHGALSFHSTTYDNFLLLGYCNISRDDERLKEFCNSFPLDHLIKTPPYYMGTNASSIDHIITNMIPFL